MLNELLISCSPQFFILSLSFSLTWGRTMKLLCQNSGKESEKIYITLFDWWKWEVIENLSLLQLDNQGRVGGEDVSSVRQRCCSSVSGEVRERELKSHTTAGGGSSHSCCFGHTSAVWLAGGCEWVKTLLFHQFSQMWSIHILGKCSYLGLHFILSRQRFRQQIHFNY